MISSFFMGLIAGTLAGLIPGIHTNTLLILLGLISFKTNELIVFVITMCIVQSFVDYIPSTFLGIVSENNYESVLPGHRLALQGKGQEAIILTIIGGLTASLISIPFFPLFITLINMNKNNFYWLIPIILFFSSILIIKNNSQKRKAIFVFIIAGTHGLFFQDQIFPLITGYFGLASVVYSLKEKVSFIKQKPAEINHFYFKESLAGLIGGSIVATIPGIGNNLAARIVKTFTKKINSKQYLVLLGSINTSNFIFSLPVLFILGNARNGAMVFLKEKIIFDNNFLFLGILTILIASGAGALITIILSKKINTFLSDKKIKLASYFAIIIMISLVSIFNGLTGLVALFFSFFLGIYSLTNKVSRGTMLSFLIIPVMFFYVFALI